MKIRICRTINLIVTSIMLAVTIFLLLSLNFTIHANSAEPPSIVILVTNPPGDLTIKLQSEGEIIEANVRKAGWERYYAFYSINLNKQSEYSVLVISNGEPKEYPIEGKLENYNNTYTLNLKTNRLLEGKYPLRLVFVVGIRLILTLLIEAAIFLVFGFRKMRSWIIFLIINLLTQGILNIWLSADLPLMPSYLIIGLVFGELFVFAVEVLLIPILVKEHGLGRRILYALAANFFSLVAGGYMIAYLPV